MLPTLPLMNDTIAMAILAAVAMALHGAMMFRGCLFETWHGFDFGCEPTFFFRVGSRLGS